MRTSTLQDSHAVAKHLAKWSPAAWWDIDHTLTEAVELGKC